jgi:hypothetical protein
MKLFNFLKKKELNRIAALESYLREANNRISSLSIYDGIVEVDNLISQKKEELNNIILSHNEEVSKITHSIESLKQSYNKSFQVFFDLKNQINLYSESLDLSEYGVYDPHFSFDVSEKFKDKILSIREEQKQMIKNEIAVTGGDGISWNGSISQGQAMVKRQKKLMLRAFNGECDSFISSVDWNNANKMIERIQKSFDAINKVYEKQGILISYKYKKLKENELRLTHEYHQKKQEEKEEQRAIREQIREEEKLLREIEAAKLKAEKEEREYQKALTKAKKDIESAQGDEQSKLLQQIAELEALLADAEQSKQRAISMAQQTRRGHIYVISNIGSFGENVYKIGMTRRLDPYDRVTELGDASVPFSFDVHAMIYSEDAPSLENSLHKLLHDKRVNKINARKEFFHVTLEEIARIVRENHGDIEFSKIAEAEQYRESQALKRINVVSDNNENSFPSELDAYI